jgi:hypothetical protein
MTAVDSMVSPPRKAHHMPTILAIDAAWTTTEPSGVAVVRSEESGWRCVAAAPSYDEFLALVRGRRIDWYRLLSAAALQMWSGFSQPRSNSLDVPSISSRSTCLSQQSQSRAGDQQTTPFPESSERVGVQRTRLVRGDRGHLAQLFRRRSPQPGIHLPPWRLVSPSDLA